MRISVDGISFEYPSKKVLEGVTFDVAPGEMVAILGPNGVGKSTLLSCISRAISPSEGRVEIDGVDTSGLSRRDLAKLVSVVSQGSDAPHTKVFESVLLGRRPNVVLDASDKDLIITERVIALMELEHLSMKYMDEVSGGEGQLVRIARAIAQQPKVLLLDEPTSNLDISNQYKVMDTVKNVVAGNGMAAIIVIHDLNLALRFADRFILVKGGRIHSAGDISVITPESLREVYGIDAYVESVNGIPCIIPRGAARRQHTLECDRKEFFDQRAEIWDEISVHDLDIVAMLSDALELGGSETVLDIGTGTGVMIPFYRERTTGRITALDMSDRMIDVARSKFPPEEFDVEYVVSDLYDYDPGRTFGVIVCYSCFPHFADKPGAIRHLTSMLPTGGKLMISHGCSRMHINHVHKHAGGSVEHDRLPDMDAMESMMAEAGLDVIWKADDDRTFSLIAVKRRKHHSSSPGFRRTATPMAITTAVIANIRMRNLRNASFDASSLSVSSSESSKRSTGRPCSLWLQQKNLSPPEISASMEYLGAKAPDMRYPISRLPGDILTPISVPGYNLT